MYLSNLDNYKLKALFDLSYFVWYMIILKLKVFIDDLEMLFSQLSINDHIKNFLPNGEFSLKNLITLKLTFCIGLNSTLWTT